VCRMSRGISRKKTSDRFVKLYEINVLLILISSVGKRIIMNLIAPINAMTYWQVTKTIYFLITLAFTMNK